jgi:hypothetical protein
MSENRKQEGIDEVPQAEERRKELSGLVHLLVDGGLDAHPQMPASILPHRPGLFKVLGKSGFHPGRERVSRQHQSTKSGHHPYKPKTRW